MSCLIALTSSLSRAVGSGVVRSRALAVALRAAGARHLSGLQSAASRVRAMLDQLTSRLPSVCLGLEEIAIVRTYLEFSRRLQPVRRTLRTGAV